MEINAINITHINSNSYPLIWEEESSTFDDLFLKFEQIWRYLGKINSMTRSLLNASIRITHPLTLGGRNLDAKIFSLITKLKLFSIIDVTYNLSAIPSVAEKIFKNYQLSDYEGVALSSLSCLLISLDTVDSLGTFINAFLDVNSLTPVAFFSNIGMPLALGMITLGFVSRLIQVIKTDQLFTRFSQASSQIENREQHLNLFLEQEIGLTVEEMHALSPGDRTALLEQKRTLLLRAAPLEVVVEMENLLELFKDNQMAENMHGRLEGSLNKIAFLLSKKTIVDIGSMIANCLSFIGLSLFFTAVMPAIPFCFLALSFFIKVLLVAYQDYILPQS